jgi:hypothetical protein
MPWAMVEYLKRVDTFPVAPTLSWSHDRFYVREGGRCLWAAQHTEWRQPIRCILVADRARTPDAVWNRTQPFQKPLDQIPCCSLQMEVLCFARSLSEQEKYLTEQEIRRLAAAAKEKELIAFSEVHGLAWPKRNVLSWVAPVSTNPEDRAGGVELFETMARLRNSCVPVAALNGRACY